MSLSVLQWKLDDLQSAIKRKADLHEIQTTNSNVDSLEHTVRQLGSEVVCLSSELETLQEEIQRIKKHLVL